MIYDCFMYNGEANVLECRLTELYDVVDKFVLVEASRTHGGDKSKPFHYLDMHQRFIRWQKKIRYIMISTLPQGGNPWVRENMQRNHILDGIRDAKPEDIIMISDVDEIPKRSSIQDIASEGSTLFLQTMYAMNLDWYDTTPWFGTIAMPRRELTTPQEARDNRRGATTKLSSAGWHITWLGNAEDMERKLATSSHEKSDFCSWINDPETGMFLGSQLRRSSYNNTYPQWVMEGHAPSSWRTNG